MLIASTDEAPLNTAPVPRALSPWAWLGIGAGAAAIGFLPWIITGMRLPLQNLWDLPTLPEDMPIVLLPFSQYSITLVAGILVVGSALAGIVARVAHRRRDHRGLLALVAGAFGVQVVAIAYTATVVGSGLRPSFESMIYLAAVVAVAIASFATGAVVLLLVARAPRAGALIGLAIAAVVVVWWLDALVVPEVWQVSETQTAILGALQWVPALLCGIAIAWCGVTTSGRIVAAVATIAILAVGPAFAMAIISAAGSRVLARHLPEMADHALRVFQQALISPELTLRPVVAAFFVAIIGLAASEVLWRRRTAAARTPIAPRRG